MFEDSAVWSQQMFGCSELGDVRRTRRLVDVAARLARQAGASLAKCCEGEEAAMQGGYRLIGNDHVDPEAIAQAGFARVAEQAQQHEGVLLAVQDTTSLSYTHEVADELGSIGAGPKLERMLVITAFVALRLMQLREQLGMHATESGPGQAMQCDTALSTEQWQVLWQIDQRTLPPQTPPSAGWACLAIARLGGFTDTKRTGRPGWDTLWHGWLRLQDRIDGFRLAHLMTKM